MATCLDTAWAARFKKAGRPFSWPRIRIYTKRRGHRSKHWAEEPDVGLMSDYRPRDGIVVLLLTAPLVKSPPGSPAPCRSPMSEGASIAFWLVNGFTHVSPRFCNTWVADPSTVA
ncbi:hypothetical protein [Streptosporangium sp. NPDC006007]|uniref:hypothetical protein n=1 Tax=Streptosporangium sp. NPDC006007 TaxID=3154575 RepID=UPI0033B97CC7